MTLEYRWGEFEWPIDRSLDRPRTWSSEVYYAKKRHSMSTESSAVFDKRRIRRAKAGRTPRWNRIVGSHSTLVPGQDELVGWARRVQSEAMHARDRPVDKLESNRRRRWSDGRKPDKSRETKPS